MWAVNLLLFVIGLVVLIKGSSWFVEGAVGAAALLDVPETIVGLTVVSIGTSLPELAANVYAAVQGQPALALGNVIGSNIANVLLILGVGATIGGRLATAPDMLRRDGPVMILTFLAFAALCYVGGNDFGRVGGVVLLLGFLAYVWLLWRGRGGPVKAQPEAVRETTAEAPSTVGGAVWRVLAGGVMVSGGASLMVDNVVWLAEAWGMPEAVIAATLVAFGTSVPELAVTTAGILKGRTDIALGNIIGSNIFNLLLVMGVTAVICPVPIGPDTGSLLLPAMLLSGGALVLGMVRGRALSRGEGIAFLAGYLAFIAANVYRSLAG